ncbi:NAD(P)-dependent alcohol dehydrogenase [Marixanthomonas sp. SCSIO 43207]|uniref:NAD(P)-dependent alcohol dehydrogenase n=1 Tax=Marixanthomonas sp. SCSIO 43207 TaxID=2779360 RepID=UPI001CA7D3B8|nr:NAD(P)-dependent alcohol dehydrogenase [Marixanthomonas sp. SCSIO 43207]UAB80062.1 NAD(P)-dependent alcohol dehydrogenase [Marixanthomonas sp. SCSIO 43207]
MKKAIYTQYGSPEVIEVVDQEKPIPRSNEVLVQIKASSVTRADAMMRQGVPKFGRLFLGLFKPKNTALGTGFSGIVAAVGDHVTQFETGDEVFGEKLFSNGCNAAYVCIAEDTVIDRKPKNILHSEAAPICDGFLTSYHFLKDIAHVQPGQRVLINGASGSLGTAAVQLAKLMGATVTGVCSTKNIDFVKSLGADEVLDYTTVTLADLTCTYDVVYDTVGKLSYKKIKNILGATGIFMTPVLSAAILWRMLWQPKKVKFAATGMKNTQVLKQLVSDLVHFFEQGQLTTHIDKEYSLSAIKYAHYYLETGRKVGNIVIINS